MAATERAGALLAKYLVGLTLLVAGLAIVLAGILENSISFQLLGLVLAAIGIFLVVLKIVARNQPH